MRGSRPARCPSSPPAITARSPPAAAPCAAAPGTASAPTSSATAPGGSPCGRSRSPARAPTGSPGSPSSTGYVRAARRREDRVEDEQFRRFVAHELRGRGVGRGRRRESRLRCKFLRFSRVPSPMALVETIRQLWQRKLLVGLVLALAVAAAIFSAYQVTSRRAAKPLAQRRRRLQPDPRRLARLDPCPGRRTRNLRSARDPGENLRSVPGQPRRPPGNRQAGRRAGALDRDQRPVQLRHRPDRLLLPVLRGTGRRTAPGRRPQPPRLHRPGRRADPHRRRPVGRLRDRDRPCRRFLQDARELRQRLEADGKPVRQGVTVRELGAPEGGTLGSSNNMILMVLAFLLVFGLGCAAILAGPDLRPPLARPRRRRIRRRRRASTTSAVAPLDITGRSLRTATTRRRWSNGEPRDHHRPAPRPLALMEATTGVGPFVGQPAARPSRHATGRAVASRAADWPHTTRFLPWALFGFVAMLWLIPFDSIKLPLGRPVDVTLDRPCWSLLAAAWLFSAGAAQARRHPAQPDPLGLRDLHRDRRASACSSTPKRWSGSAASTWRSSRSPCSPPTASSSPSPRRSCGRRRSRR